MKTYLRFSSLTAAFVTVASTLCIGNVTAQQPAAATAATQQASAGRVAVIDMARVFKFHTRFNADMEAIKAEVAAFEKELNDQRKSLIAQRDSLSSFKPGTPEYKRTEEAMARSASDLQVKAELKRKDILDREAKLYHGAYKEIVASVTELAQRYGITLVLRYESEAIDPQDRGSVLKGVNREVVFQRNLDLTSHVLDHVNRATAARAPAAANAASRSVR